MTSEVKTLDLENKVDEESIDTEFERFIEMNDIDLDTEGLDDNTRRDIEADIRKVKRGIKDGRITIDDKGHATVHPRVSKDQKPITFGYLTGNAWMESDRKKGHQDVQKQFAVMGACSRRSVAHFGALRQGDLKYCQAVFSLLADL